jgi:hypothetical protein
MVNIIYQRDFGPQTMFLELFTDAAGNPDLGCAASF